MARWIADRLPAAADGDIQGMVRWGPLQPGLLMPWQPQQEGAGRD